MSPKILGMFSDVINPFSKKSIQGEVPFNMTMPQRDIPKYEEIVKLLKKHFPDRAIPAILGNIDVETDGTFDFTKQQNEGGPGYGLFQFDAQKEAYFEWLEGSARRDSADSQIQFAADAIYNDEYNAEGILTTALDIGGPARKAIRSSFKDGSTADMTKMFSDKYENPRVPNTEKRIKAAEKWEKTLGKKKLLPTDQKGMLSSDS